MWIPGRFCPQNWLPRQRPLRDRKTITSVLSYRAYSHSSIMTRFDVTSARPHLPPRKDIYLSQICYDSVSEDSVYCFGQLILRKIIKIVDIHMSEFEAKCTKIQFRLGSSIQRMEREGRGAGGAVLWSTKKIKIDPAD